MKVPVIPLALAGILSLHGLRKRSLSLDGAIAAFFVGTLMMDVELKAFGVSLIVFYLVGSRATKYGKSFKATLEDGHDHAGGGYRDALQVICNSFGAFVASMLWALGHSSQGLAASMSRYFASWALPQPVTGVPYDPSAWCPLTESRSRVVLFLALGHFSCCLGDTLASELGILSRQPPILITTLRRVPAGTNGAISFVGTMASFAGGAIMGVTLLTSVLFESSKCRQEWMSLLSVVLWGTAAGGIGSLIDTLLGATVQQTRFSTSMRKVLQHSEGSQGGDVKIISGWNILTNSQINLVSSILTALLSCWFA